MYKINFVPKHIWQKNFLKKWTLSDFEKINFQSTCKKTEKSSVEISRKVLDP